MWELDGDITGVKEASEMKRFHCLSDGDYEMSPECYRCADHLGEHNETDRHLGSREIPDDGGG